jgi:hypothetical protein
MALCVLSLAGCGDDNDATQDSSPVVPDPVADSGGLRDFFGSIEGLSSTSLVVDGRTFLVDNQTHVFREGTDVGYGFLAVGNLVLVKARVNSRGELVAREIKLRVDNAPDVKVSGRVESVNLPDLVVAGRLVHTNSGTAVFGAGDPKGLPDVRVGDQVTVTGPEGDDRSVLANKIRVEAKG